MESLMHSTRALALRRAQCPSCLRPWNTSFSASIRAGLQNSDRLQRRYKGYIAPEGQQAMPLTGFYADILKNPLPKAQSLTSTTPAPPPPDELPKTDREETLAKARIVFGSRLAGPGERAKDKEISSKVIAGIMVPPKPTEPDNCCMSGCVNCVWDMYRDDMEEWAAKSAEARAALQAQRAKGEATGTMVVEKGTPSHVATSMDDDGGGSESNGALGQSTEDDSLFADIPVGIRQFMKTEKMLKQKHSQESAS